MNVLGIRAGHDASASMIIDGKIVADVSEERFTRIKNDSSFPYQSIKYCLRASNLTYEDIDIVSIPAKDINPIYFSYLDFSESNLPKNINQKSEPTAILPIYIEKIKFSKRCQVHCVEHHLAHAASACYTSGLSREKNLVFTIDGAGDNISVAIWIYENNQIKNIKRFGREGSLGWFYANATEALNWKHGSDEWKLMGLAPYGTSKKDLLNGFYPEYKNGELVRGHSYGEFGRLNDHGSMHYHGQDASALRKIAEAVGDKDFSAEVQRVVEEQAFNLILPWIKKENCRNVLCAGGFFLNVKFNQKLWYKNELNHLWIYPNCGDSGIAAGAALYSYYNLYPDKVPHKLFSMYQGPEFSNDEIKRVLEDRCIRYEYIENPAKVGAQILMENKVMGWFQGRMEAGPRALGNRSILMSPLNAKNKDIINHKIKYRESFRPFTPSMLYEAKDKYLINSRDEEFMVCSFDVRPEKKDAIPAVVHVDGTARPQMVRREVNSLYYDLIKNFAELSGESVVLNTSLNIKGEPIVLSPRDAIKCFYDTGMDAMILGNFLLKKYEY